VPAQPVSFRWWTSEGYPWDHHPPLVGAALLVTTAISKLRSGQLGHPGGCHVALYRTDERGAAAELVFEVAERTFAEATGSGAGTLRGELGPNGVFVVDTGEQLLWPIGHPRVPYPNTPAL
jgi:hypothetical protein